MMDDRRFRALAEMARREQPPSVDVARGVMLRLRAGVSPAPALRPLVWTASIGLAIAVPLAMAVPLTIRSLADPLLRMFMEVTRGLP